MFLLNNATQAYAWGSRSAIPTFLGRDDADRPVAEMWMGTHPLGPSKVEAAVGVAVPLTEVAGELPFMMKILAADQPLSLQVHPGRKVAAAGFADEEASGKPITAPDRSFKDANHKPEMAYALTTFDTLVGFRPTAEILRIMAPIESPFTQGLVTALRAEPGFDGIVHLVEQLLCEPPAAEEIASIVAACELLAEAGLDIRRAYATAVEIAQYFPDDVGVVLSMFLNRFTLQPGEAIFLSTGIIHAHLRGMCIEVMAASDNVLRAGLTSKFVDTAGMVRCLRQGMSRAARVTPDTLGLSTEVFSPDVEEFALSITQASYAEPDGAVLPNQGQRIVICTGGEVTLVSEHGGSFKLSRGDSVYAGPEDGVLRIFGLGEVAQAYEPTKRTPLSKMADLVHPFGVKSDRGGHDVATRQELP